MREIRECGRLGSAGRGGDRECGRLGSVGD